MKEAEFRALLAVEGKELVVGTIPTGEGPLWVAGVYEAGESEVLCNAIPVEDCEFTREETVQRMIKRYYSERG